MYDRVIDGKTLTIRPSGWTYDNTFVLIDEETGSMWYPYRKGLMSIQGEYFKRWLPEVDSTDTSLAKWQKKHPNTKLLK